MKIRDILNFPSIYEALQRPLRRETIKPLLERDDIEKCRNVLDIGCGPGTYADFFTNKNYVGVDIETKYIEFAKNQYPNNCFLEQDASNLTLETGYSSDFVLINSILHHLDNSSATKVLSSAAKFLSSDGHIHILELVDEPDFSVSTLVTHFDRGNFARPFDDWEEMFSKTFKRVESEPYKINFFGICICKMIYFKGSNKNR